MMFTLMTYNAKSQSDSLCCATITSGMEITEACCVKITISFPNCNPAPVFYFYQNENSLPVLQDVIFGDTLDPEIVYQYCGKNGEIIEWLIQVRDPADTSQMFCDENNWWGFDHHIGGLSPDECCHCPPERNDWFKVVSLKDTSLCDNYGCRVSFEFNPDADSLAECYTHYIFERPNGYRSDKLLIETNPLDLYDTCITAGSDGLFNLILFSDAEFPDSCVIEKYVFCDSCDCPEDRNDWLISSQSKSNECGEDNCKVQLNGFAFPEDSSAECWTDYIFIDENGVPSSLQDIRDDPINDFSFCLDEGEEATIKIQLLTSNVPPDTCTIERTFYCEYSDTTETLPAPCYPDCPGDTFEFEEDEYFAIGDCLFKVTYMTRYACETWQDVQIISIEEVYDDPLYPCNNTIYTLDSVFRKAFFEIVKRNEMGFSPQWDEPGCDTTWRFIASACWQYGETVAYPSFVPCDSVQCCRQRYLVCRDTNNQVSLEPIGDPYTPDPVDCKTYDEILDSLLQDTTLINAVTDQCWYICDWLWFEMTYQKIGIRDKLDLSTFYDVRCGISFNSAIFWITSGKLDDYVIEIYDLLGNTILRENIPRSGYETIEYIDIGKYSKGAYLYRVIQNNVMIGTGKIIVK